MLYELKIFCRISRVTVFQITFSTNIPIKNRNLKKNNSNIIQPTENDFLKKNKTTICLYQFSRQAINAHLDNDKGKVLNKTERENKSVNFLKIPFDHTSYDNFSGFQLREFQELKTNKTRL